MISILHALQGLLTYTGYYINISHTGIRILSETVAKLINSLIEIHFYVFEVKRYSLINGFLQDNFFYEEYLIIKR